MFWPSKMWWDGHTALNRHLGDAILWRCEVKDRLSPHGKERLIPYSSAFKPCSWSQVTFIYIALLTIPIVSKHLTVSTSTPHTRFSWLVETPRPPREKKKKIIIVVVVFFLNTILTCCPNSNALICKLDTVYRYIVFNGKTSLWKFYTHIA